MRHSERVGECGAAEHTGREWARSIAGVMTSVLVCKGRQCDKCEQRRISGEGRQVVQYDRVVSAYIYSVLEGLQDLRPSLVIHATSTRAFINFPLSPTCSQSVSARAHSRSYALQASHSSCPSRICSHHASMCHHATSHDTSPVQEEHLPGQIMPTLSTRTGPSTPATTSSDHLCMLTDCSVATDAT